MLRAGREGGREDTTDSKGPALGSGRTREVSGAVDLGKNLKETPKASSMQCL